MTPSQAKRILLTANVTTVVIMLAGTAATWSVLRPHPPWSSPAIAAETPTKQPLNTEHVAANTDELAAIWQRDLRQPLHDQPKAPPPSPRERPRLAIQLVGTALEKNEQFGLFRLGNNSVVVKAAGDSVAGCQILAIERGRAYLRRGNEEHELRVPWYDRIDTAAEDPADGH